MIRKSLIVVLVIVIIAVSFVAIRDLRPRAQSLGDYLQNLFVANGVGVSADDFLEPVDDPYLAFAKILSLVPPRLRVMTK